MMTFVDFMTTKPTADQVDAFVRANSPFRPKAERSNSFDEFVPVAGKVTVRGDIRFGVPRASVKLYTDSTYVVTTDSFGDFFFRIPSKWRNTEAEIWGEAPPTYGPSPALPIKLTPPLAPIRIALEHQVRDSTRLTSWGIPLSDSGSVNAYFRARSPMPQAEEFYRALRNATPTYLVRYLAPSDSNPFMNIQSSFRMVNDSTLFEVAEGQFKPYIKVGALTINDCSGTQYFADWIVKPDSARLRPSVFLPEASCPQQWMYTLRGNHLWQAAAEIKDRRGPGAS